MKKRTQLKAVAMAITVLLISIFAVSVNAAAEDSGFVPAETQNKYTTEEVVESLPKTFEFTVRLQPDYDYSDNSLFTNRHSFAEQYFEVWVDANGAPVFYLKKAPGSSFTFTFSDVDLRTGEWEHVVIVRGERDIRCYVNGELKARIPVEIPENIAFRTRITVGGHYHDSQFFEGVIKNIALYSVARSEEEVLNDYVSDSSKNGLVCSYDFTGVNSSHLPERILDLSQNDNNLKLSSPFYDELVNPIEDYAYAFAIVGDIQKVTAYNSHNLPKIYDWIIDNKDEKKIAFVANLGDLTDNNTDEEWKTVDRVLHSLDGVVPYSVVRGNHDKSKEKYKEVFTYREGENCLAGSYDGSMLFTYQTFTVAGNKYLFLNLDLAITSDVLSWADKIVEEYADHNVIVTTHAYLDIEGTPLTRADPLNPKKYKSEFTSEELWNYFISKHKNITMVISGHRATPAITLTQRVGVHGNTVNQLLVDPSYVDLEYDGGVGNVAMLYFSEDGKNVTAHYYSTIKEAYFIEANEIEFAIDTIQSGEEVKPCHEANETLSYDADEHWNVCVCGKKVNVSPHVFGNWTITVEATKENDGERVKRCECGHTITESYKYTSLVIIFIIVAAVIIVLATSSAVVLVLIKRRRKKTNISLDEDENDEGNENPDE